MREPKSENVSARQALPHADLAPGPADRRADISKGYINIKDY